MLDTGHFLHTNLDLKTQEEGVDYLNQMLDAHGDLVSYIKGIHLQQSLTGDYVKEWLSTRHEPVSYTHLLNLAAVMAMDPKLLILDEPTSMLDPLAAANLLGMVRRINREMCIRDR